MAIVSLGGLLYLLPPLCCGLFFALRVIQLHVAKHNRRKAVLDELKATDPERKRLIGFFHPYCFRKAMQVAVENVCYGPLSLCSNAPNQTS